VVQHSTLFVDVDLVGFCLEGTALVDVLRGADDAAGRCRCGLFVQLRAFFLPTVDLVRRCVWFQ